MTERPPVPEPVVARLREICLPLPEASEHEAWTGTAWRVRTRTFAHVVVVADGWPPAYLGAMGVLADDGGPTTVLTFRSAGDELEALGNLGPPYFRPPWHPGAVGMVLGGDVDWGEVTELVTESYCLMAPAALAELVDRPG
jgi:predicted DNA-binding protein (MmcQ/YjbR family)